MLKSESAPYNYNNNNYCSTRREVNDRLKLVIYVLCVELLGDQTQVGEYNYY